MEGNHGGGEKKEVLEFVLGVLTKKRLSLLGNETKTRFHRFKIIYKNIKLEKEAKRNVKIKKLKE